MMPVQKVVNVYKASMSFKSQSQSSYHFSQKNENPAKENSKESFKTILENIINRRPGKLALYLY